MYQAYKETDGVHMKERTDLEDIIEIAELMQSPFKQSVVNISLLKAQIAEFDPSFEIDESITIPHSSYESRSWIYVISSLYNKIENAINQSSVNKKGEKRPFFATRATGMLNSSAIDVGNKSFYLILLDDGLFSIFHLYSKIISRSFKICSDERGRSYFEISSGESFDDVLFQEEGFRVIADDYIDLLSSYLINGVAFNSKKYVIDRMYLELAGEFRDAMQGFVLAHELGHCYLGHLSNNKTHYKWGENSENTYIYNTDWKQEFEADSFGAIVYLKSIKMQSSPIIGFAGVLSTFLLMQNIDSARSILVQGKTTEVSSQTHPPHNLRMEALFQLTDHLLSPGDAKILTSLFHTIKYIAQRLQVEANLKMENLHKRGEKAFIFSR